MPQPGQGVGRALLRWAEDAVQQAGRPYLRLDCWALNSRLRRYYEAAGFTWCGDCGTHWPASRYEKRVDGSDRPAGCGSAPTGC